MIAWNYPVALLSSYYFLRPDFSSLTLTQMPIYAYGALGLLMPSIFLAIAASIRYTGIVRTEVAQRLSLFISILAAFFLFNEQLQLFKIIGIVLGFLAISCSIKWQHRAHGLSKEANGKTWIYPLLVFLGMGVIDVLYKQLAQYQSVTYYTSITIVFTLCTLVSFIYIAVRVIIGRMRFSLSGTLWGIALGLFNFGNIIFYMRAHRAIPDNPSLIFSSMNIGVILLGALVGVLLFKEKLSLLNKIGLVLAVVAVVVIGLANR